jgi:hypothetical protein
MPDPSALVLAVSLGYVAYYVIASVYLTLRPPAVARPEPEPATVAAGRTD